MSYKPIRCQFSYDREFPTFALELLPFQVFAASTLLSSSKVMRRNRSQAKSNEDPFLVDSQFQRSRKNGVRRHVKVQSYLLTVSSSVGDRRGLEKQSRDIPDTRVAGNAYSRRACTGGK